MEVQSNVVSVQSLVPINYLQLNNVIAHKYWHLICKAEFLVLRGLQIIKISIFLILYDYRLYLTIAFEFIPMLQVSQQNLQMPYLIPLKDKQNQESIPLTCGAIPMPCGAIPMGMGVWEVGQLDFPYIQ